LLKRCLAVIAATDQIDGQILTGAAAGAPRLQFARLAAQLLPVAAASSK